MAALDCESRHITVYVDNMYSPFWWFQCHLFGDSQQLTFAESVIYN